ncbi:MAG: DUF3611 family protein [Leptolyngbyaceae cyanobacterium MO_188.B28]|nr:DUF3611 family protein [Leptolyngbyaceae cyanobacterium MO_188.B28]
MLAKSKRPWPSPAIQKIANAFRLWGWVGFWAQLSLAFTSGMVLLFAVSGRSFTADSEAGIGLGIFWGVAGILALGVGIVLAFRYTQIAKGLRDPAFHFHPKKSYAVQLLRIGVLTGLVGVLFTLLGAGATVSVLIAKTVSQPPGVAITDPTKIVRALDVFVMLANLNGITAHFVGIVTSLWLLERLHTP